MKKYQQFVSDAGSLYSQWFYFIGEANVRGVERLLPNVKDIDMKTRGKEKKTGLFYAIEKTPTYNMMSHSGIIIGAMVEIVNLLLTKGANPNIICTVKYGISDNAKLVNATALWKAAVSHCVEHLNILLMNGADPNIGSNPIEHLSSYAFLPKISFYNDTMIHYSESSIAIIKQLLHHKAKIPNDFYKRFKNSINTWYKPNYEDPEKVEKYKKILEDFVEWLIKNNFNVPSEIKEIYTKKTFQKFDL